MKFRHVKRASIASALVLCFFSATSSASATELTADNITKTIDVSFRSDKDRARDQQRKPAQVLSLLGIEQGMTVLDINAGGGYYSEILSLLVGSEGRVISHNDPVYHAFFNQKDFDQRYGNDRLPNVSHYRPDSDLLSLDSQSVDAAIMALSFHDYFYKHKARNEQFSDADAAAASIYSALKPGARLVVVDHIGQADGTLEDWSKKHRIAPSLVEHAMTKAGFRLEKTASFLLNSDDPLAVSPFAPDVRGKTSRFVHVYIKE